MESLSKKKKKAKVMHSWLLIGSGGPMKKFKKSDGIQAKPNEEGKKL